MSLKDNIRKCLSLSAALVVAGGVSVMSIAPATASTDQPEGATAAPVSGVEEASFEAQIVGDEVRISLSNAQAVLQDDGSVEVLDDNGDVLEAMPTTLPGLDGSPDAGVSYEVTEGGTSITITPDEVNQSDSDVMQTSQVDQDCAAQNVFWGIGASAVAGIPGGPAGIVGGATFGAGVAGVQSIIHC